MVISLQSDLRLGNDRRQRRRLEGVGSTDIALNDGKRSVPRRAHNVVERHVRGGCRRHEARAKRVAREVALKARAAREALDEIRDVPAVDPAVRNASLRGEGAEQRAGRDRSGVEVRAQRPNGAERLVGDERDGDVGAHAFLVRLRAPDRHEQAALREPQILDVERRELGAPSRAGEAEKKKRTIALRRQIVAADGEEQLADDIEGGGVDAAGGRPVVVRDPADDLTDDAVRAGRVEPRAPVVDGDRGETPADRPHAMRRREERDVQGDRLRARWQHLEATAEAERLEASQVARVALARTRRLRGSSERLGAFLKIVDRWRGGRVVRWE